MPFLILDWSRARMDWQMAVSQHRLRGSPTCQSRGFGGHRVYIQLPFLLYTVAILYVGRGERVDTPVSFSMPYYISPLALKVHG